jgi:ribosomal protein L11 methyltransferase
MKSCGELEFVLPKENAEAFCVWAREAFGTEPVWMERPRGRTAVVAVYGADEATAAAWARRGIPGEFGVVSARARRCDEREWTGFWRHHFKTTDVGRRLRVVPAWEKAPDRRRVNLKIDPGLSFGTGMHFTTRFCLEQLEEALEGAAGMSVLDAGSGSGILAIAAAKLGAGRIDAYDVDPVCVRRFAANRRLNRVPPGRIRYELGNVMDWGGGGKRYGVVCANILSHLLIRAAERLWALTEWRLILAGIRDAEADEVAAAYWRLGARERVRDSDGEWCGLVMERSHA